LANNTTGDYNTGVGVAALRMNTTGSENTAHGRGALYKNVSGNQNTAVGMGALYWNTANVNTAVGSAALGANTTGSNNTALGADALEANTTAGNNTALGIGALQSTTTGGSNTAVGAIALSFSTGHGNTAVGHAPLLSLSSGDRNVAVGHFALDIMTAGSDNTAIGTDALGNLGAGNQNTSVGSATNTCIGCSNTGAFGFGAVTTASNTIRIGNASVTQIGGSVAWSNLSDGRYKTNVKPNVPGLEFIEKLKPVTFNWKLSKLNEADGVEEFASDPALGEAREAKAKKLYTGFIAQDVEAAARECGFDFSGVVKPANEKSRYELSYAEFVVPLVKAVQEQQKEIEDLRETVRGLASERRLREDRLGQGTAGVASQFAGVVGDSWGGMMTLVSAALVMLHLKRRRDSQR
jgi:trimeric autotransporter adhesin